MGAGSMIVAILAVGVLIVFHEAGHFLAARWSGMSVSRFSIGFGPAIAKFERGGTVYQIGVLPLGGFVQIDGMSPHDGTDPSDGGSYLNKPFHQKFATILAGPFANYLLAFFLLVAALMAFRFEMLPPVRVTDVQEGSPAAQAGLEQGDLVHGAAGDDFEKLEDFLDVIARSDGAPIPFDVERGGERVVVTITPKAVGDGWRIGAGFAGERTQELPGLGLGASIVGAAQTTWAWTKGFVVGLASIVDFRQLQGPVGIVKSLSDSISRSGSGALPFIAQISVVLGVANMLPIPGLDGSRLMFLLVGAIRRKPVEPRLEAAIHTVGVLLLLLLLVAVTIKDTVFS